VLLPSASVFLLLLCNDREVLGPWCNRPWLNALASVIVAVLVLLSLILMATTVFPGLDVTRFALAGGGVLAIALGAFAVASWRLSRRRSSPAPPVPGTRSVPREEWTMAPLALLTRPRWSLGRRVAMVAMSGYLWLAVALLVVKVVQLAGG
jgi:hypothetical protein